MQLHEERHPISSSSCSPVREDIYSFAERNNAPYWQRQRDRRSGCWSRHHRADLGNGYVQRVADDLMCLIDTANAPIFGIDTLGKVSG